MSKKSVDKKLVVAQIKALRMDGKSDQDIYAQLSTEYFDRKTVATIITATVTEERKRKYRDPQITLLVVLGLTIVFKLLIGVSLIISGRSAALWVLLIVLPAVNVYFFVQILRYQASIYRSCGMLGILGISRILNDLSKEPNWMILVDVGIIICVIALSFYLDAKLFPNYSPQKMEADANGDYRVG